MKISEIFYSIQGEGKLTGVPSVFIRTTGCNLRCVWCDSDYTSWKPEGEQVSIDMIVDQVARHGTGHVVVTGGEPMIAPDVGELTQRLKDGGYHLTIETAATVWREVKCDLASISPKLSHSTPWTREAGKYAAAHEENRIHLETIRRFMAFPDYQLKFVIQDPDDLAEIDTILSQLGHYDPSNVLLMPLGIDAAELNERGRWIADLCKHRGYRFCPRLHIELFGHRRGT